jgi:hypothetical protein
MGAISARGPVSAEAGLVIKQANNTEEIEKI